LGCSGSRENVFGKAHRGELLANFTYFGKKEEREEEQIGTTTRKKGGEKGDSFSMGKASRPGKGGGVWKRR